MNEQEIDSIKIKTNLRPIQKSIKDQFNGIISLRLARPRTWSTKLAEAMLRYIFVFWVIMMVILEQHIFLLSWWQIWWWEILRQHMYFYLPGDNGKVVTKNFSYMLCLLPGWWPTHCGWRSSWAIDQIV